MYSLMAHSNGCGLDIGVKDGKIVGVRGRAVDRVNHGRLGPKGLNGHVVPFHYRLCCNVVRTLLTLLMQLGIRVSCRPLEVSAHTQERTLGARLVGRSNGLGCWKDKGNRQPLDEARCCVLYVWPVVSGRVLRAGYGGEGRVEHPSYVCGKCLMVTCPARAESGTGMAVLVSARRQLRRHCVSRLDRMASPDHMKISITQTASSL